jgi:hypothetical protein
MKTVLIVCGVLSVLLNLVLIYGGIDNAVTMDHQQQSLHRKDKQLEICKTVLMYTYPKIGYQHFLELPDNATFTVSKKVNSFGNEEVRIGNVLFEFSKDKKLIAIGMPYM